LERARSVCHLIAGSVAASSAFWREFREPAHDCLACIGLPLQFARRIDIPGA
jgi:hypothetical protein